MGRTLGTGSVAAMQLVRPRTVDEACSALSEMSAPTVLAGGTDLMVEVNLRHLRPPEVVATGDVDDLASWDDGWIGAGVTFARLESSSDRGLGEAARTVGSPQIRAAGTLGGNLGTASPAGDALPFLACVEAGIVLASSAGRRELRWDEYLQGPKLTARRREELIVGVTVPPDRPRRQGFAKVGVRQAMVIAIASCCVARSDTGETRVALGSVGPTVLRARRAEEMISGENRPSGAALDEFQRLVSTEVRPITDHRATADYRRHAAGVIARRTLERLL